MSEIDKTDRMTEVVHTIFKGGTLMKFVCTIFCSNWWAGACNETKRNNDIGQEGFGLTVVDIEYHTLVKSKRKVFQMEK